MAAIAPSLPNDFVPQEGPQTTFLASDEDEVLYGGAAYGAKTISLAIDAIRQTEYPLYKFKIFRRTYSELNELISYANEYYPDATGAENRENGLIWKFPSGAIGYFCHMEEVNDWMKHAGESVPYFGFDELTTFEETQYLSLMPWNRTRDARIKCYIRATTNPWGPGFEWVYKRFIEPTLDERGRPTDRVQIQKTRMPDGTYHTFTRRFIPSRFTDNKKGMEANPGYVTRLMEIPDTEKRRAYMDGSWDIRPGQFFSLFRTNIHVLEDDEIVKRLRSVAVARGGALDWGGQNTPLCYLWGARAGKEYYVEREHYKAAVLDEHIPEILDRTPKAHKPLFTVADPSIWKNKGFHASRSDWTLPQLFGSLGLPIKQAIDGHTDGYNTINSLLLHGKDRPPRIFIARSCVNLIRELKAAERDDKNPDEVKNDRAFHAIATLRYLCLHLSEPNVAMNAHIPKDSWEAEFKSGRSRDRESVFVR